MEVLTLHRVPSQVTNTVQGMEGERSRKEGLAGKLRPLRESLNKLDDVRRVYGDANDRSSEVCDGESVEDCRRT